MNKNYRIKKVTYGGETKYYPQQRFLWRWYNIFSSVDIFFDGGFDTLDEAQKQLCEYLEEPVIEYINFDCERDCK